jgi:hypothetical protein
MHSHEPLRLSWEFTSIMQTMRACLSVFLLAAAAPASAQINLQGAVPAGPASPTGSAAPAADGQARKPAPAPLRAPGDEAVSGREFQQHGYRGTMRLEGRPGSLRISRLVFDGDLTERPGEACRVEIQQGVDLEPAGRPAGLIRYKAALEICPFTLEILDGAVSISGQFCEVKAAACTVDPSGLWGPAGTSIRGEQLAAIERARRAAEERARTYFRTLLNATKDRNEIKRIAADQAGFSSRREEVCSAYQRETVHGFCGTRLTEARAFSLRAELDKSAPQPTARAKPARKPSPPRAAEPAPASNLY